jgi:hypothetical protein
LPLVPRGSTLNAGMFCGVSTWATLRKTAVAAAATGSALGPSVVKTTNDSFLDGR